MKEQETENGPLTPALSPKGEREKMSRNLHQIQGFDARIFSGESRIGLAERETSVIQQGLEPPGVLRVETSLRQEATARQATRAPMRSP